MQSIRKILARTCIKRKTEEEQPDRDWVLTREGASKPGTAASQELRRFQQEGQEIGNWEQTTGFGDGRCGVTSERSFGGRWRRDVGTLEMKGQWEIWPADVKDPFRRFGGQRRMETNSGTWKESLVPVSFVNLRKLEYVRGRKKGVKRARRE